MRTVAEHGEVIIEPSEDAIFGLIVELAQPDNAFLIVDPAEDASEWFASVRLAAGGGYEVEYRDVLHRYHRLSTETGPGAIASRSPSGHSGLIGLIDEEGPGRRPGACRGGGGRVGL